MRAFTMVSESRFGEAKEKTCFYYAERELIRGSQ